MQLAKPAGAELGLSRARTSAQDHQMLGTPCVPSGTPLVAIAGLALIGLQLHTHGQFSAQPR
jgi:hypothetical protein